MQFRPPQRIFVLNILLQQASNILSSPIEYLKGVGPQRADLLKKELGIFNFEDLLNHFPLRHIDKTKVTPILEINPQTEFVQVAGLLIRMDMAGEKRGRRLTALLKDNTGIVELVWFQGISYVEKLLQPGQRYLVSGRTGFYQGVPQISHPDIEPWSPDNHEGKAFLEPVYPSTEKLKARGMGGRQLAKLTFHLLGMIQRQDLPENLPENILAMLQLTGRYEAYHQIHFPGTTAAFEAALKRLKFEELFIAQLRMKLLKVRRHRLSQGVVFSLVGDLFNTFYQQYLPFQLTNAQKRVIREIRADTAHGRQMNRLLQGDVGSGKTIVALCCVLLSADNGFQSCLMAPTEILANQHYQGIAELLKDMPVQVRLLTGSTKKAERTALLAGLASGEIHLLIGTHAVIEEVVRFHSLGLVIVDEQHRFGVAQRSKMWKKAAIPPHVLVMTATPIPRTLAMTAYGDLDYSVIDELPPGRKPITTAHRFEYDRTKVLEFIKSEIDIGRQAYIIFPLIEESEKVDYENLMRGYENVKAFFPEPAYWISMVHGQQKSSVKQTNMARFVKADTQIMVATTVIEVGVNVPNASVMVIESAEKFGLSQLHQLRGRVGRGAEKSFCILLTGLKPTKEARERIKIMCATNDGFKIAEKDLDLRGPGDIEGTRQSGLLNFRLANIVADRGLLETAKAMAEQVVEMDPDLTDPQFAPIRQFLHSRTGKTIWSKIS